MKLVHAPSYRRKQARKRPARRSHSRRFEAVREKVLPKIVPYSEGY